MKHHVTTPLIGCVMIIAGCLATGDRPDQSDTRVVSGRVPSSSAASLLALGTGDCVADTVIATDTAGEITTTAVNDDCSFSITLQVGKSYSLSFAKGDQLIADLLFESGVAGFATASFSCSPGENIIDLGVITISGSVARPDSNPLDHVDQDQDGIADLEDHDDDGDEVPDEEEMDCDLDGIWDDFDEENLCEEPSSAHAHVLEVKPRNDPHPELGEDDVDLDKDVKARISCEVDPQTVTSETFRVASEDGQDVVACTFEFSGTGSSGNRIECEHEQPFLPHTVYIATIEGVRCLDGREVEARSWSWLTEGEDKEEGDVEDHIDEEDEVESGEDHDHGENE